MLRRDLWNEQKIALLIVNSDFQRITKQTSHLGSSIHILGRDRAAVRYIKMFRGHT